jgi:DNA-binding TFAR19-related protein (PDSD5 family)
MTTLADAFDKLRAPRPAAFDVVPQHIVRRVYDAQNARRRAARKALVKPENAAELVRQIADLEEGDRLHAVLPGNFVFAEILTQLAERMKPQTVTIATLSLSKANVDALAAALDAKHIGQLEFLISDYFGATNKAIMAHMEQAAQNRRWRIGTKRTHAKIATLDTNHLVIETSANLRSSQNVEQLSVFRDRELHDFHTRWITDLMP